QDVVTDAESGDIGKLPTQHQGVQEALHLAGIAFEPFREGRRDRTRPLQALTKLVRDYVVECVSDHADAKCGVEIGLACRDAGLSDLLELLRIEVELAEQEGCVGLDLARRKAWE